MYLGLVYQIIRFIADLVLIRTGSGTQLRAEVLALRHKLRVLERKVGKPAWQPGDRILLADLSRLLPRSGFSSLLPRPETCSAGSAIWSGLHARARLATRSGGSAFLKLARENPRWGYHRIQGEALKLGFRISHMGVAAILRSHRIPPAPRRSQSTWREREAGQRAVDQRSARPAGSSRWSSRRYCIGEFLTAHLLDALAEAGFRRLAGQLPAVVSIRLDLTQMSELSRQGVVDHCHVAGPGAEAGLGDSDRLVQQVRGDS